LGCPVTREPASPVTPRHRRRRRRAWAGVTDRRARTRDGQNLLAELDAALDTLAQYTDFPGRWGGLSAMRRGGASSFYGYDMSANTRQLFDAAGAAEHYLYSAFGPELLAHAGANPYRFGGQVGYYRDEAERLYVRAREFAPGVGRWVSRDPLGFDGGDANLLRYVANDPVWYRDPPGLARIVGTPFPPSGHWWIEFECVKQPTPEGSASSAGQYPWWVDIPEQRDCLGKGNTYLVSDLTAGMSMEEKCAAEARLWQVIMEDRGRGPGWQALRFASGGCCRGNAIRWAVRAGLRPFPDPPISSYPPNRPPRFPGYYRTPIPNPRPIPPGYCDPNSGICY